MVLGASMQTVALFIIGQWVPGIVNVKLQVILIAEVAVPVVGVDTPDGVV